MEILDYSPVVGHLAAHAQGSVVSAKRYFEIFGHSVDQAALEHRKICLPLSTKSCD